MTGVFIVYYFAYSNHQMLMASGSEKRVHMHFNEFAEELENVCYCSSGRFDRRVCINAWILWEMRKIRAIW